MRQCSSREKRRCARCVLAVGPLLAPPAHTRGYRRISRRSRPLALGPLPAHPLTCGVPPSPPAIPQTRRYIERESREEVRLDILTQCRFFDEAAQVAFGAAPAEWAEEALFSLQLLGTHTPRLSAEALSQVAIGGDSLHLKTAEAAEVFDRLFQRLRNS